MRGRSSGKTGPPVPGLTRVGGGAINCFVSLKMKSRHSRTLNKRPRGAGSRTRETLSWGWD